MMIAIVILLRYGTIKVGLWQHDITVNSHPLAYTVHCIFLNDTLVRVLLCENFRYRL